MDVMPLFSTNALLSRSSKTKGNIKKYRMILSAGLPICRIRVSFGSMHDRILGNLESKTMLGEKLLEEWKRKTKVIDQRYLQIWVDSN